MHCNPTPSEYKLVELQGPRCSIRSRAMYSDCTPDYIKMTALNIPAAVVVCHAFQLNACQPMLFCECPVIFWNAPLLPRKLLTLHKGVWCSDHADTVPCCLENPHGLLHQACIWLSRPSVAVCMFWPNNLFWLQTLLALFSIDDVTGFQITNLVELPEPYGIIFLWGAVFPSIFIFVASITNFVFKDNLILKVSKQPQHIDALTACVSLAHWSRVSAQAIML